MTLSWSEFREKGDYRWVTEYSGLYKLYRGELLLYVGHSNNIQRRLMEHERNDSGWGYFRWASTKGVPKDERIRIEERIIRRERPPWNIKGR